MKINKLINSISLILLICLKFSVCAEDPSHFLWYQQAAKQWHREALPIGNGRLGAMLFGGVNKTQIQFNVDSLWTGDETYTVSYQAFGALQIELNQHSQYSDYRRALDLQTAV
ncbi:MAG: glycoside hydrolase N-terminal domain-containing protein, partial [Lentisphaeraceae bacterium]|nr:glycoside hydrolase N-terminal domain-containing protein [Lentisphaeraceae bacterium]